MFSKLHKMIDGYNQRMGSFRRRGFRATSTRSADGLSIANYLISHGVKAISSAHSFGKRTQWRRTQHTWRNGRRTVWVDITLTNGTCYVKPEEACSPNRLAVLKVDLYIKQ